MSAKMNLRILFVFAIAAAQAFGQAAPPEAKQPKKAAYDLSAYSSGAAEKFPAMPAAEVKNVIFIIGDGMGLAQVSATRIRTLGPDGRLFLDRMPVTGLLKTHPVDGLVTDSAAAGTALATGMKTNNGKIGVGPDGKKFMTILEAAAKKGMRTGLVATSTITHATPASFAAHVKSRGSEADIALDMLANRVNVMLGGGRAFFLSKDKGGKREDGKNLLEEAQKAGYAVLENKKDLSLASGELVLGLFKMDNIEPGPEVPTEADMAAKAIELLYKDGKGFFLMIEGSQIDWRCHDNDLEGMTSQVLELDAIVKIAVDFALKDKCTLVVVTADHETGGLVIAETENARKKEGPFSWTAKGHSGTPVPVYAFSPSAESFSGVMDNTDIPKKMAGLLGISGFPKVLE